MQTRGESDRRRKEEEDSCCDIYCAQRLRVVVVVFVSRRSCYMAPYFRVSLCVCAGPRRDDLGGMGRDFFHQKKSERALREEKRVRNPLRVDSLPHRIPCLAKLSFCKLRAHTHSSKGPASCTMCVCGCCCLGRRRLPLSSGTLSVVLLLEEGRKEEKSSPLLVETAHDLSRATLSKRKKVKLSSSPSASGKFCAPPSLLGRNHPWFLLSRPAPGRSNQHPVPGETSTDDEDETERREKRRRRGMKR